MLWLVLSREICDPLIDYEIAGAQENDVAVSAMDAPNNGLELPLYGCSAQGAQAAPIIQTKAQNGTS